MSKPTCLRCGHRGFRKRAGFDRPTFTCDRCHNQWTSGLSGEPYASASIVDAVLDAVTDVVDTVADVIINTPHHQPQPPEPAHDHAGHGSHHTVDTSYDSGSGSGGSDSGGGGDGGGGGGGD